MIIGSNLILEEIITALSGIGVPVNSVIPPSNVRRFVYVTDTDENAINTKTSKLSEGFVNIQVVEKFVGDEGSLKWVTEMAQTIVSIIQPEIRSTFGITNNLNIFALNFENQTSLLQDTEAGRTASRSLRLKYYIKTI